MKSIIYTLIIFSVVAVGCKSKVEKIREQIAIDADSSLAQMEREKTAVEEGEKKRAIVEEYLNKQKQTNNGFCTYSVLDNPKSEGLDMKVSYPCLWQMKDGDRPHVVKKFSKLSDGQTLVNCMVIITKLPKEPTTKDVDGLFTEESLKSFLDEGKDKYISGKKVSIDGQTAGEIIFETSRVTPIANIDMKALEYIIFYKNYLVRLQYMTGSQYAAETKKLFDENKQLFALLAIKTIFVSKWK